MDVRLAIASKRDHRDFDPRPLPADVLHRILDAGRLAGSARNRQPWRFFVAEAPANRAELARCVYAPRTVAGAAAAVAVAVRLAGSALGQFDAGRAAQNMMLAAWSEGVASCPNGIADPGTARAVLGVDDDETPIVVISLGFPARPRDPGRRTADEWSARAARLALDRFVVRLSSVPPAGRVETPSRLAGREDRNAPLT
jgi:nitroreductase